MKRNDGTVMNKDIVTAFQEKECMVIKLKTTMQKAGNSNQLSTKEILLELSVFKKSTLQQKQHLENQKNQIGGANNGVGYVIDRCCFIGYFGQREERSGWRGKIIANL